MEWLSQEDRVYDMFRVFVSKGIKPDTNSLLRGIEIEEYVEDGQEIKFSI